MSNVINLRDRKDPLISDKTQLEIVQYIKDTYACRTVNPTHTTGYLLACVRNHLSDDGKCWFRLRESELENLASFLACKYRVAIATRKLKEKEDLELIPHGNKPTKTT